MWEMYSFIPFNFNVYLCHLSFNLQTSDKRENTDYIKSLFWLSAFAFKIQKKISFLLGPFCIYKMARKFHWGCQQGRLFRKNISAEKIGGACGFLLVRWIAQWMLIFNLIYHFITNNIKQVLILFLA